MNIKVEKIFENILPLALIFISIPPIFYSLIKEFGLGFDGFVFILFGFLIFFCYALSFLALLIELGWVVYYLVSGGSLFDLKIRKIRNRAYSGLKLGFFALLVWVISFFSMTFHGWLPTLSNASQPKLINYFEKNKESFDSITHSILAGMDSKEIGGQLKRLGFCGEYLNKDGSVYLYLYREDYGVLGGGYHKGFVFSEKALVPQIENIDKEAKYCNTVFRKINGNWYIFYYFY